MAIELSFDEAKRLIEEAIAEKGENYVYPEWGGVCRYFESDGTPSCIVGHALAKLSVTLDMLAAERPDDELSPDGLNSYACVPILAARGVIDIDDKTCTLLYAAQNAQDTGLTWREAYEAGLEAASVA